VRETPSLSVYPILPRKDREHRARRPFDYAQGKDFLRFSCALCALCGKLSDGFLVADLP
jgi:hypothetical protein